MKTSIDEIIEKIDSELLNLFNNSQKKSEYHFFDFYEALVMFNEGVLKEASRQDYFKLKAKQFRDVFRDLLFTESKVTFIEYVSYDAQKRIAYLKVRTCVHNKPADIESFTERIIDSESQHEYLKSNIARLKEEKPIENRINKYNYLLENCTVSAGPDSDQIGIVLYSFEKKFKSGFGSLFDNYSLDIRSETTFDEYIKKLQFLDKKVSLKATKPSLQTDTLEKACNGVAEFNYIKKWFLDKKLIDPVTLYWKDTKKGSKSELANYIKELKDKGYTKNLTHAEIISISLNSFGVKISIDTMKGLSGNASYLPKIPYFKKAE
jgi:hypothetical protein